MPETPTVDFEISTNEDWRDALAPAEMPEAEGSDPVPLDPSSWLAARMHIRKTAKETAVDLELSLANGKLVATATTIATNVLKAEVARALAPGTYAHDLVFVDAEGAERRLWAGTLTVVQGVTR